MESEEHKEPAGASADTEEPAVHDPSSPPPSLPESAPFPGFPTGSPSLSPSSSPPLLLAFELTAHSPFTVTGSDDVQFDLSLDELDASVQPVPFAAIPITEPASFSLAGLRLLLSSSLRSATLSALSSQGLLTPHQSIALTSSQYSFLRGASPVKEEEEDSATAASFSPLLLLRVWEAVSRPHSQVTSRRESRGATPQRSSSPMLRSTSEFALSSPSLPASPPVASTPRLVHFSRAAGDGIQEPMVLPRDASAASSTISYSRAATLPIPVTRRGSFDISPHLDTLSMLDGHSRRQVSTSDFHPHGLRPPALHGDNEAMNQYTLSASSHGLYDRTPSLQRQDTATQLAGGAAESDDDAADEEISPVDYPQHSSRRTSTAPTTPPMVPPSVSLPSTLNTLLDYLQQATPTSGAERRASMGGHEGKAYYNSLDTNQPSLISRRMSAASTHQLTLELRKENTRRAQTPSHSQRRDSDEKESQNSASRRRRSVSSTTGPRRRRAQGRTDDSLPHFHDMLNEHSKSGRNLRSAEALPSPPSSRCHVVVVGERDRRPADEQKEREGDVDRSTQSSPPPMRHRKNIVSDVSKVSTRIQPIPFRTDSALDAVQRVQVFDDVGAVLRSRADEKREPQKMKMTTLPHHEKAGSRRGSTELQQLEPLWVAVEDASPEAIAQIGEHFGLHPLTIEDVESIGIREKLEVFTDYLFIVFHALDITDDDRPTASSSVRTQPRSRSASPRPTRSARSPRRPCPSLSSGGRARPSPSPHPTPTPRRPLRPLRRRGGRRWRRAATSCP